MHLLDRVNLALMMVAVALGAVVYLTTDRHESLSPLTSVPPESITTIELHAGKRLKWAALRTNSGWTLTHPEVVDADSDRIGQLMRLLTTPSIVSFPIRAEDRVNFGLAPPAYRVVFDETDIQFGVTEPTGGRRYVQLHDQVHIIGDGFLHHLLAPAAQFRAKTP